ncbi:hypothetical protein [Leptospira langatensis]|uniref:hypothetical protein n=1 Tax=Leptospira langatensis TaxID=2484983 RepID=UPI0014386C4D|nr:hypothetical protein [Leptospira langatensis]
MRIETSAIDSITVPLPVQQPGSEASIEEDRKKEENTPNSDYLYALSVGSLINVQV